jgi:hypothetical protein
MCQTLATELRLRTPPVAVPRTEVLSIPASRRKAKEVDQYREMVFRTEDKQVYALQGIERGPT